MTLTMPREVKRPLKLQATTAADMMMLNPVSLRAQATVREAIEMLTTREFGAAPVIDEAGRPLGVLSQSDLLVHQREQLTKPPKPIDEQRHSSAHMQDRTDTMLVRELMTPIVFAVSPETPAEQVVEQMLALKVHRLFVVDETGVLVGTISAIDVLRHLQS